MLHEVLALAGAADVFIGVAAVADWRALEVSPAKIKKTPSGEPPSFALANNPDILASVAALPSPPLCVGFAAETGNLLENARAKLQRKGVAMIVANQADAALGADAVELLLVDARGARTLPMAPKLDQARQLMAAIAERLRTRVDSGS
jgi:phosphopantothenoylcysteine decarboxylase/phosphopantothenate--cysteine ligase